MIRTIEHSNTAMIQKIMVGSEILRYQVVPKGQIGNSAAITVCSTLHDARARAGIAYNPPQMAKKEG